MKYFKITLIFVFFFSTKIFSEDISTIELHSSSTDNDIIFNDETNDLSNINENAVAENSTDECSNQ